MGTTILTLDQLKQFDGTGGKPAYIAYKGKVYDVSRSDLWSDGDHQGMHVAGRDLTDEMSDAPHDDDVLSRYRLVGELSK